MGSIVYEIAHMDIDTRKMHKRGEISDKTCKHYKDLAIKFGLWCKEHCGCRHAQDCPAYLQAYADWLVAQGKSTSTVHTYLAGACRWFGVSLETISKPMRVVSDNTRSRGTKAVDTRSDAHREASPRLWDFAAAVGIRRKEYAHLCGNDFVYDESGYPCVRVKRGKGGKYQEQRIAPEDLELVRSYFNGSEDMEEIKSGITPLCNNFSKNALEERMTAIMKTKKSTVLSIALAVLIVAGTATAFATSAKVEDDKANSTTLMAGIEKTYTIDGKTYYEFWDGTTMEESEYLKKYPMPEVEWWTYEEYKEWLDNEKKELQSMLGSTGSINGEKFTWTQEKIDEAIAMYEEILQEIKDGVKYSKTVNEEGDPLLSEAQAAPSDTETSVEMAMDSVGQQEFTQEDILELYGDYGISLDKNGDMIFQGELVRLFWDGVDVGDGAASVLYQYYNKKDTVDVHTVRSAIDNGDGSVDPFGKLVKIEKDSQEVFDRRDVDDYLSTGTATTTASGFSSPNDGTSFAEVMKKYAEFGIRYESGDGLGNIYYNNQLVKTFIDKNKQGDVFTLSSEDGGEIVVHTVYDKKGNLTGVEIE